MHVFGQGPVGDLPGSLFFPLVYACLVFSTQPWSEAGKVGRTLGQDTRSLRLRPKGGHAGLVAKPCLTLCDPKDHSLPGYSVHGISQTRIWPWVAISFSRGIFATQASNPHLLHYT